ARLAVDLMFTGPYLWVVLGALLFALAARRLLEDAALIVVGCAATLIATALVAFNSPQLAPLTFARYVSAMSEALAVFLVVESMRSADGAARRVSVGGRASAPLC